MTREYVWGPGYADEIVCQLDYSADPLGGTGVTPETYYYLQDANYNVVAVVSPGSVGVPPAVVWQYAYEPYGRVVTAEAVPPPGAPPGWAPPVNRVGFQGLFLEPVLFNASNAGLSTSSISLWCARNRFILSSIGRFLTRDPAEAAIPVINAMATNGGTLDGAVGPFSPGGHYANGFNLYEFVGSNPVNRSDPLGLEWGFEEEIDDLINDRVGHALAALGTIQEGAKIAALGMNMALGVAASLLPGAGLYDLYKSGLAVSEGKAGFWDYLAIAGVAAPAVYKAIQWGARMYKSGRVAARSHLAARLEHVAHGAFSVFDWTGYPGKVPKPKGPFILVEGAQYEAARAAADKALAAFRKAHPECAGKQVHHIHPVKLGGSPTDPANLTIVEPDVHYILNNFWGRVQRDAQGR